MTTVNDSQFKSYLEAISEKYKCWWNLYTLTDAEGKERLKKQQEKQLSSPFNFGLMVETLQPKQEKENQEQEKQEQEKKERLPVLEGIRKYAENHVLLVGKPGSGKSTALARLLLEEAQAHLEINFQAHSQSRLKTTESSDVSQFQLTSAISQGIDSLGSSVNYTTIPILVELRYWQTSIFERIQAFLQQHDANLNLDETTFKNLLRQGKFLLLIDGVNELPSEESRRQLAIFRKDYPQTQMIFTTRDLTVGGDLGIEKKLEMQPLNESQIREFVMAYLPQQGEELLQRLQDRLREFGKTPLLLWMLCGLFQQTGNIPPNLGMVFRLFTQSYENNWRGDVAVTAESRRWWKSLLEHLAFKMMQGNAVTEFRVAIPKGEVEEIFTKYLTEEKFDKPRDNAKCWLEDLLKHHLIQVGSGEKIEFRHQLLQEYYAAEYLLRQLPHINDVKLKRNYLNLLKWSEPLALMLALVEDETQALRVVQLALNVDLMLGARLAGEVKPDFQQQPIDWILEKKLPKLLETELLKITRSDCAVDALINALKHEDSYVRRSAADALGKIGSQTAVDALINALKNENYYVRKKAVDVLGKIGSETAVDALKNASNHHQDSDVRRRAVDVLRKIGSETAVKAVKNVSNHHQDSDARRKNADTSVKIGSETTVDALINALNDENHYVRRRAALVLGEIGSERAVDALINALKDQSYYVRKKAADALEKIGSERAVDALINTLNDQDLHFRRSVAKALVTLGSEKTVDAFIKALNHQDSYVRESVAEALVNLGSETTVDALINALNHQNSDVGSSAASALGKISSETAFNALVKALNHQDSDVRRSAASALRKIGSKRALDTLINFSNDQDSDLRRSSASALVTIGSETTVNALINALNHEYFDVRRKAVDALGKIGSQRTVDALINALNNQYSDVRRSAAKVLGEIADSDKIAQMWKLLLNGTIEARDIILQIQERYKFYNHEIFYSSPVEDDESTDETTQPQKILILAAIPRNLRLDREIRSIEECIRRAVRRDIFKVEIKTAVQPQDIRRAIAEEKPQIVHFCGHGLEDGSLVLEDDGENEIPVPTSGLAALFQLHADYVKCVVLNACHSIKAAEEICQYIDYAIGMNKPIQDTLAIKFAQGFYDGLGYDSQNQDMFQRAFQEGLVAIKLENLSQAEIPVIKTKY